MLEQTQHSRPDGNQQHRWQNEEEDREHQLDADLGRALFSLLPSFNPHIFRVSSKSIRHARAEPISLREHRNQLADLGFARPVGKVK